MSLFCLQRFQKGLVRSPAGRKRETGELCTRAGPRPGRRLGRREQHCTAVPASSTMQGHCFAVPAVWVLQRWYSDYAFSLSSPCKSTAKTEGKASRFVVHSWYVNQSVYRAGYPGDDRNME